MDGTAPVLIQGPPEVTFGVPFLAFVAAGGTPGTSVLPPGGPVVEVVATRGETGSPLAGTEVTLTATRSGRVRVFVDDVEVGGYEVVVREAVSLTAWARSGPDVVVTGSVTPDASTARLERLRNGAWEATTTARVVDGRFDLPARSSAAGLYRVVAGEGVSVTFRI
jgi:hypothetical protein